MVGYIIWIAQTLVMGKTAVLSPAAMDSQKHVDPVNEGSSTTLSTSLKINKAGIVLTPQPTDDPKDPLVRSLYLAIAEVLYSC